MSRSFPEDEYRDARRELSEFNQDVQALISDLPTLEEKKRFLDEYEFLTRLFLRKDQGRITTEEEILAYLLCQ